MEKPSVIPETQAFVNNLDTLNKLVPHENDGAVEGPVTTTRLRAASVVRIDQVDGVAQSVNMVMPSSKLRDALVDVFDAQPDTEADYVSLENLHISSTDDNKRPITLKWGDLTTEIDHTVLNQIITETQLTKKIGGLRHFGRFAYLRVLQRQMA